MKFLKVSKSFEEILEMESFYKNLNFKVILGIWNFFSNKRKRFNDIRENTNQATSHYLQQPNLIFLFYNPIEQKILDSATKYKRNSHKLVPFLPFKPNQSNLPIEKCIPTENRDRESEIWKHQNTNFEEENNARTEIWLDFRSPAFVPSTCCSSLHVRMRVCVCVCRMRKQRDTHWYPLFQDDALISISHPSGIESLVPGKSPRPPPTPPPTAPTLVSSAVKRGTRRCVHVPAKGRRAARLLVSLRRPLPLDHFEVYPWFRLFSTRSDCDILAI